MNRDELVDAMRTQTDLDDVDVTDQMAHMFLQEAFERTAAQRRQWPAYQSSWTITVPANTQSVALPVDVAEIASLRSNERLNNIDQSFAEEAYAGRSGRPGAYSIWGRQVYLWPKPTAETTISIRGWRLPNYAWLGDTAQEVDLDERLHMAVLHYAVSLVYAQQEDAELETQYMRRWQLVMEDMAKDIDRPPTYRPIVLNGGEHQGFGPQTLNQRFGFDSL